MWKKNYEEKKRTIEEAILTLPKKVTIVVNLAAAEPQGFLSNLHKFKNHFEDVKVLTCLNMNGYPFFMEKEYEEIFENDSWFYSAPLREAKSKGFKTVDFISNNLHMAATDKIMAEKEEGNKIVLWAATTQMNEANGYLNLGLSNVYEKDMADVADMIILEVNEHMPRTHGETEIHIKDVDYVVENNFEIPALDIVEPTSTEQIIAEQITELVEDGSTIQIGIGGIPNAVAKLLKSKRNLGVHTEMFTESMIDLYEEGIITNNQKSLWKGKFICTFALGSKRMYKWLDDNPAVWIMRGKYVNDPHVISLNKKMVSINTALSVDLTGQVSSESIGTRQFSGTGGQLDTHIGAIKSEGGKGIIALRSTAKKGTISTIVPNFTVGTSVTVPRQYIDYVVTEYGVAHLRGRTLKQRVLSLINISHPDYREFLNSEAIKAGYL